MKGGETARVFCPGSVDKGGNVNQYHQWGEAWTHVYTNRTYEFEMVECSFKPKVFHSWFAPKPAKITKPKPVAKPVEVKKEEPVEPPKPKAKPTPPKPAPFGSKIIEGKHFVLASSFEDSKGKVMVMAAKEEDKYPKKKIGVHMVYIAPFKAGDPF